MTAQDAQARIDQILAFQAELRKLEADQVLVLSDSNKQSLQQYHQTLFDQFRHKTPLDINASAKRLSLGMRAFSLVAAFALVAFVFFVLSDVWGLLGTGARVALLIGLSSLSLAGALVCRARDTYGYFVAIAAVLAVMCFAMNLLGLGIITNTGAPFGFLLTLALYAWLLGRGFQVPLLLWVAGFSLAGAVGIFDYTNLNADIDRLFDVPEQVLLTPFLIGGLYWLERKNGLRDNAEIYLLISAWIAFLALYFLLLSSSQSRLPLPEIAINWLYSVAIVIVCGLLVAASIRWDFISGVQHGLALFVFFIMVECVRLLHDVLPYYLMFLLLGVFAIGCVWLLRNIHRREFFNIKLGARHD